MPDLRPGAGFGNIRFRGVSLGVTYVFFIGILAGALGLQVDSQMLSYAESFGLILFVYTLGLQVGPGFVSAFRQGGTQLNLLAVGVVLIGTLMALVTGWTGLLSLQDMMGVLAEPPPTPPPWVPHSKPSSNSDSPLREPHSAAP